MHKPASIILAAAVFATAATAVRVAAAPPAAAPATSPPIVLVLDAREAPRNILHVSETLPVVKPGPLTLAYPKWIPGEHGPTGPIQSLAALRVTANGVPLYWQRDLVDMYAFHVEVPAAVTAVTVAFDQLMTSQDPMSTPNLLIVNWNRVLLYPADTHADDVAMQPSILLPHGWTFGTALPVKAQTGDRVDFDQTSLSTLVDSPLDAGRYGKKVQLLNAPSYSNEIDAFADAPDDLDISSANVQKYKNLVAEADALYGARHWYHYHFLLTLTDAIGFQGIEHHQSSDNRASDGYWTDSAAFERGADLLPHEFSHSWNGKYRRPADLTVADYQAPEKTDLLWVYEGLNQYLGDLLAFRSGFVAPKDYPEYLAHIYAQMDAEPGRRADPLADTAIAAPYLYQAPDEWASQRRSADDFYTEGELLWLSVDAIVRTQSHGAHSLDTFLKAFYGGQNTAPMVVTYTRQDVVDALNAVAPYDWDGFFHKWVYEVAPHPPADGINLTGWRLTWNSSPNHWDELDESVLHRANFTYSLGISPDGEGRIGDVLDGSPAARAGIGPDSQIVAVNGRKYAPDVLHRAVQAAKSSSRPIAMLVVADDMYRTVTLDYHGGDRYPHLQRVAGSTDLLAKIMAPHRAR